MTSLYKYLPTFLFALTTLAAGSASAQTICPFTYLFELNGQHYYTAVECHQPHCNPTPIGAVLIYDELVVRLGCDSISQRGEPCRCRTTRVVSGAIEEEIDTTASSPIHFTDSKKPFQITKDDFTVTQFGSNNYYFRAMTFASTNTKTGELETRSVAIPLTQKRVTELAEKGNAGEPVVFKESIFDGKKVSVNGTAFVSVATEKQIPQLAQLKSVFR